MQVCKITDIYVLITNSPTTWKIAKKSSLQLIDASPSVSSNSSEPLTCFVDCMTGGSGDAEHCAATCASSDSTCNFADIGYHCSTYIDGGYTEDGTIPENADFDYECGEAYILACEEAETELIHIDPITYETRPGCTDPLANNYDRYAEVDDGSCSFAFVGCTDPTANNYNAFADVDDGSCSYTLNCNTDCSNPACSADPICMPEPISAPMESPDCSTDCGNPACSADPICMPEP